MLFSGQRSGADYEELVAIQDRELGLRGIVVIHSTTRGPAFGGIRRRPYPDEEAAVCDAMALAETMSFKCALAGLPAGGGKTVLWSDLDVPFDRDAVYGAVGRTIERLAGRYIAGPDLGTSDGELDVVRAQTRWVNPAPNDAGASTAAGVAAGMRAVFARLGLEPGPNVRVAIQGLGAVGLNLATRLLDLGVTVCGADPVPEIARHARTLGVEIVEPGEVLQTPCDVLSPCAFGGIVTAQVVPALRCRAICGSANNQLADGAAAAALDEAGIVHAPDVIVSAGAVIEGVLTVRGEPDPDEEATRDRVQQAIDALEIVTAEVLEEAARWNMPPDTAARRRAREILRGAKEA